MSARPPGDRPAARLILLDAEDRVLLLKFEDLGVAEPDSRWEGLRRGVFGEILNFRERYYLARVGESTISLAGHTDLERRVYRDHRWWSPAEIATTDEAIFPERLVEILRAVSGSAKEG